MSKDLTHIILIAFHFPPDPASGAARPSRFYKYLPEFGYQPHVFTVSERAPSCFPNVTHVPSEAYAATRKTPIGIMELSLRKTFFKTDHAVLWAPPVKRAIANAMRQIDFKAVISTFPPINTHLAGSWVNRRYKLPWIADYRDPLINNPFRQQSGLSAWTDRTLERRFVESASALLANTDIMLENWKKAFPRQAGKMKLLWNGFDPEDTAVSEPIAARNYRVLAHVGTLYGPRTPEPVLGSIQRLIDRGRIDGDGLRVRLIGHLDPVIEQSNAALLAGLKDRGILHLSQGMLPRDEAQRELKNADLLFLVDITEKRGYAVPAKLFEYIQMGRPILAYTDEGSPVDRILAKAGIPYQSIYRCESPDQVDEKILAFLSLPSDPVSPSQWYLDQFDGRRQTATLARILDSCIGK